MGLLGVIGFVLLMGGELVGVIFVLLGLFSLDQREAAVRGRLHTYVECLVAIVIGWGLLASDPEQLSEIIPGTQWIITLSGPMCWDF